MIDLNKYENIINHQLWTYTGEVTKVVGMGIESLGPMANIGDICYISTRKGDREIKAEVIGFKDENLLLMPLGQLEGIGPGCKVKAYGDKCSSR